MKLAAKKRRAALGIVLAALIGGALAAGGLFAGSSKASTNAAPRPTTAPSISGTAQEGQTLTGDKGRWSDDPNDYNFVWMRCNRHGRSCNNIAAATEASYRLTSADVGSTLRFKVQARNRHGSTDTSSAPTAVVAAASTPTPPVPPTGTGCPAGNGNVQAADVSLPARLIIDQQQANPSVVTRSTTQIVLRYHVTDTCGQSVGGALVYVTATPFNQLSIPGEQPTGPDGWAQVTLQPLAGFPVSPKQQLIALFVRARKQGENALAGISTRRLFSLRVSQTG